MLYSLNTDTVEYQECVTLLLKLVLVWKTRVSIGICSCRPGTVTVLLRYLTDLKREVLPQHVCLALKQVDHILGQLCLWAIHLGPPTLSTVKCQHGQLIDRRWLLHRVGYSQSVTGTCMHTLLALVHRNTSKQVTKAFLFTVHYLILSQRGLTYNIRLFTLSQVIQPDDQSKFFQ